MIEVPPGGLFFEDVEPGVGFETPGRAVTAADIDAFAELTGDHHGIHMDDAAARAAGFPGRIAHGLFGLALMEGIKAPLGLFERSAIASLGWDRVRFLRPILVGDRVRLRVTFTAKRRTSRPGRGVVTEFVELLNQRDEVVSTGEHPLLVACRGPGTAGGAGGAT
ncbi:MAG TPA: MaoC/PaaZ C-terminal domain-containing protein [Geminicoccaceae bacterium]|nr:MaoC/PaaZ C-terminal domain-containing protein [Geminicoccaceae bacterium]